MSFDPSGENLAGWIMIASLVVMVMAPCCYGVYDIEVNGAACRAVAASEGKVGRYGREAWTERRPVCVIGEVRELYPDVSPEAGE